MPQPAGQSRRQSGMQFDAQSVAAAWDFAAEAYDEFQRSGGDYYRFEFFGPAQVELCGDVRGLRVIDLGCGAGYFSRQMAARGAAVTGVDISERQIEHARRHEAGTPLGIEYIVMDATEVGGRFERESFDLVTSCLALQDMPQPGEVTAQAFRLLRPGGRMNASITHPFTDTPYREWERDENGDKLALKIDRYFDTGPVEYTWPASRQKYEWKSAGLHATLSEWLAWMLDAGFLLRGVTEPRPTEEQLAARPDLEDCWRLPYYLMFDLEKPA